jgi:DNA-binding LytR/AlgR family response regulator
MLRIVLVDDEPGALANLEHIFEELPDVIVAGSYTAGEKALAAVDTDKPDAVFLDIEMPGKNGLELARELYDTHPEIKVVFVTAYAKYMKEVYGSATDYLLKPVRKQRIQKTLDILSKHEGGQIG